jgi:excinuclease ABC subunit C
VREGGELPDLILIDGGLGQVHAAQGVLDELSVTCDVAGLAKRDEEIWLSAAKEPIRLSRRSEALKVLQFVRDETHRFATGLNQKLRSADLRLAALESVDGIGPKRAAAIMKAYGSLAAIAAAKPADIARTCGIAESTARAVRAAVRLAIEDNAANAPRPRSAGCTPRTAGVTPSSSRRYTRGGGSAADLAQEAAEPEAGYGADEKV